MIHAHVHAHVYTCRKPFRVTQADLSSLACILCETPTLDFNLILTCSQVWNLIDFHIVTEHAHCNGNQSSTLVEYMALQTSRCTMYIHVFK